MCRTVLGRGSGHDRDCQFTIFLSNWAKQSKAFVVKASCKTNTVKYANTNTISDTNRNTDMSCNNIIVSIRETNL